MSLAQARTNGPWYAAMLAALIAGCVPRPAVPPEPHPQEPSLAHAQTLEQSGEHAAAARIYLLHAATLESPEREAHQLHAAELLVRAGQRRQAGAVLDGIDPRVLEPELAMQRSLLQGRIALAERRPLRALQQLPAPDPQLPVELRLEAHRLRAQAYEQGGDLLEGARERILLGPLLSDPGAVHANRRAIWEGISQLSPQALQQLRIAPPPDQLSGWLELAYLIKRGRLEPARLQEWVDEWRTRYPGHPADEALLQELLARQRELQQPPTDVALLLPLGGELTDAARAVRNGFLAAHYTSGAKTETTVHIYDTAQSGSDIWQIYDQAIKDGATFVVGPLSKDRVSTLARAGRLDVPLLALNFAEATDESPPKDFLQFGLSPEDEARQVAERASIEGLERALVLVPEGEWGERLSEAFFQRFTELGGVMLESARYDVSESDFSRPIQRLLNLDESDSRYRALRNITGRDIQFEPRRRQDVDIVFLAAFPRHARLIMPQLHFHHAQDLPVLATSHSYGGTPDADDDRDMNGLIICDMPWMLAPEDPLRANLKRLWPEAMSRYARLFALGIDAYNLLPYARWLQQERYERFAGHTGSLYFDGQARIHRALQWARFQRGRPVRLRNQIEKASETN
ncbi:MAG: ABC transporter substrate-binding protein [Gammaproteobacteria bacterium]|nr:ABC transporter substrate-binding protein [Gammaproteobacteria bacterium]NIR98308.1 ABC transporter substrate-binding protein [Gammaproteobacteria bacterium]NIT64055.1 ABC transporter substrate-binding protein [Gammaproteobacteria bacterium]NIV20986.1 ABC transporter substrate-binding protein [Gammaproteobacteria bacterium]NIX10383.1 ABC transporter substrate-binding protein [Gammaproteobacteria bacterium]